MRPTQYPWQLIGVLVADILDDHQQRVIDYLKEENRVLRDQIGHRQVRLNEDQRRRLVVLGTPLCRKVCSIVTPDIVLRWHRKLIAGSSTAAVDVLEVGQGS